ncbi:hypothetical protein GR160_00635 [Flavobacterium sp. Sd200]|uniref:hypothetical protein n=1 Tax=Flavobacterium sp. Sd200 TaxID=2692211 RepID=UPI001371343B|nr:hypothetical protein [Flavobacterium sp. Sd200]MXN89720.1 hypothetical protein [Flavobacterium sp. Sd200]
MSKSTFSIAILFLFLCSCGKEHGKSKKSITDKIVIDTFSTFPAEIDGCACYYSNNETEFNNGKYIYADDYNSNAFVKLNGKMVKLLLTKSDTLPEKRSNEIFENNDYEVIINTKQTGQIDETWQSKGTITIMPKKGKAITKPIFGECGC